MKIGATGLFNLQNKKTNASKLSNSQAESPIASITVPLANDVFRKTPVAFQARLPFENKANLKITCLWCGQPMITEDEFRIFNKSWPQSFEPFSAKYVIKAFKKASMNSYEKNVYNKLQEWTKRNPDAKFVDLLENIDNPPKRFKTFADVKQKLTSEEFNSRVIKLLKKYEKKMHPTEKEVFSKLKTEHRKSPEKSIQQLMLDLRPEHLKILEENQIKIINQIDIESNSLSEESAKKIKDLTTETRNVIIDEEDEDPFKRKVFLAKINNIIKTLPKDENAQEIIKLAYALPKSLDNVSAFIVKYSGKTYKKDPKKGISVYKRRSSKEIGTRLLSQSKESLEHFIPTTPANGRPKGEDNANNWGLACAGCNNSRASLEGYKAVQYLYSDAEKNCQKQVNTVIKYINNGQIKDAELWPEAFAKTVEQETTVPETGKVLIKLDTSRLKAKPRINIEQLSKKYNFSPVG